MKDSQEKPIEELTMKYSIMANKWISIDILTLSMKSTCNFVFLFRDHKTYIKKLQFADDEKLNIKKEEKFTDFDEEIKLLRNTITKNSTIEELDSVYKKIEDLLWNSE